MTKELYGATAMRGSLRFQAILSAAALAGALWLAFFPPAAYRISSTEFMGLSALALLAAASLAWSVKKLSTDWDRTPLAIIDEQRGVWGYEGGYGYVPWGEILGGRVKRYIHRGGTGFLLDIEVPEAIGLRYLERAPWTWRPIRQWRSERGYYLRVASDLPLAELEEGLGLIERWKRAG